MARLKAQTVASPAGGGAFHLAETAIGIFLVDQPAHQLAIGSDRRSLKPLKARDGWIMPAGSEGVCQFDAPHEFMLVEIPKTLIREMGGSEDFTPQVGNLSPLVVELAMNAPSLAGQNTLFRETMERALVVQMAQTVTPFDAPVAALDDPRLRRAVSYVHDHLADDLSLEIMAEEAAMSAFHFARAFKSAIGASPLQYVIRTRIETAQSLLKSTQLPVSEIAHRVGYEDLSRFGQHFKRQVGATPGAWRVG